MYEKRPVVVDDLGDPQGPSLINYDMNYLLASCRSRTTSKCPLPGDQTAYVHQPLLLCEKHFENTQSTEGRKQRQDCKTKNAEE